MGPLQSGTTILRVSLGSLRHWLFFAHTYASLLLAVGNLETTRGSPSWTDELRVAGLGCQESYVEAAYFACIGLTSVGYGDKLVTTAERAVNSVMLLAAQLFAAKVCADLTWLVSTHNIRQQQIQSNRAQTRQVLTHMGLPRSLVERVLAYQRYVATVHKEDLMGPAFAGLSDNLIKELRLCSYRSLVLRAPFLREQSREVIALIVGALRDMVFLPADLIMRAGMRSRDLYFMRRGRAAVYLGSEIAPRWGVSEEVTTHEPGHYFGEIGMLTGRPRGAWVMAKTYCVVSILPYTAIEQMNEEFPGAFTTLVQSMVKEYDMKASLSWADVATRLNERVGSVEDAFAWCCGRGDWLDDHEDELSAEAFDQAMRRMKVPELDRKIFWADMDKHNTGVISFQEFTDQFASATFVDRGFATPQRRGSTATVGSVGYFGPGGTRDNRRLSSMSRMTGGGFGSHLQPPSGRLSPSGSQAGPGPSGLKPPFQALSNPKEVGSPANQVAALSQHGPDSGTPVRTLSGPMPVRTLSDLACFDGNACAIGHTFSDGHTKGQLPAVREPTEDPPILPGALVQGQRADMNGLLPSREPHLSADMLRKGMPGPAQTISTQVSENEHAHDVDRSMVETSNEGTDGQAPQDSLSIGSPETQMSPRTSLRSVDPPSLSADGPCPAQWMSDEANNSSGPFNTPFRTQVLELLMHIDERVQRLEAATCSGRSGCRRSMVGSAK